jgi:hypothetical protein
MTEVAKDFQISDRAMAKICARKQVPVPPRGYWAKKSAGKDVPKPSLPDFVEKAPKEQKAKAKPQQQPPKIPKVGGVFEERNQKIRKSLKELRNVLSEAVDYTARIESWNWDYSFGLNYSYNLLRRDNDMSFLHESPLCPKYGGYWVDQPGQHERLRKVISLGEVTQTMAERKLRDYIRETKVDSPETFVEVTSKTASTTLKIAVLAPMPRARARTATAV